MNNDQYDDDSLDGQEPPSKSQRKRDMHALQDLGEKLTRLSTKERGKFNLDPELLTAIEEYLKIKQNSARKRHLQFIGKVMRRVDADAIEAQMALLEDKQSVGVRAQHLVEEWRDRLVTGNASEITEFLDQWPNTDIQAFRQLVRNAQQEYKARQAEPAKPPIYFRKLFQFIQQQVQTDS